MEDDYDQRRRDNDAQIQRLVDDVSSLKVAMTQNTIITEQVRDVLASFRVAAAVSKWGAAITAGALALWHLITKMRGI